MSDVTSDVTNGVTGVTEPAAQAPDGRRVYLDKQSPTAYQALVRAADRKSVV